MKTADNLCSNFGDLSRSPVNPGGESFLKTILLLALLFPVMLVFSSPAKSETVSTVLAALVVEAYQNNQELQAMVENVMELRAEAPFAGSLQDPVVGIGLLNLPVDTFDLDQEAMTQKQLFVAQKFPWFGTLDLKQQIVELKALEAGSRVQAKRLEIGAAVAEAWYDLGFFYKSLEVNENLKALITQTLRVAESRYATGKGLQQDILLGQVRLSELIDEEINLKSRERNVQAKLSALLNRVAVYMDGGSILEDIPEVLPAKEKLTTIALQFNPQLQAAKIAVDRAKVEVLVAEKAYLPNFDLRLSYGQREDNPTTGDDRADFFSATMAMTVPLYQSTRQDSKLKGAQIRLAGTEKKLIGLQTTLPHRIDQLITDIHAARENHNLYRNALSVQAANLADASLAAYSVGKVEFNTMLSARVQILQIELKAQKYKYQVYKKRAALEELIGTSWSQLEGIQ